MKPVSILITFFLLINYPVSGFSQTEWRMWNAARINFSVNKKLDLHFNHLRSYVLSNNLTNNFNQTSASFDYDISKHATILGGIVFIGLPASGKNTQRYYARFTYKVPIAKVITWSNAFQAETNSASETRFRNRFIYITRISNKKRFDFLNLNLSAAYSLFFNMGGNQINYYDQNGSVVATNSPDGFHRSRLFLTANSKISKNISISVYYMKQQEFNLLSSEFRKINVINPATGKISRSFDNYNVAGLSFSLDFDLYKKKKSSSKKSNSPK